MVMISKLKELTRLGGWLVDDLCIYVDLDDIRADPRINNTEIFSPDGPQGFCIISLSLERCGSTFVQLFTFRDRDEIIVSSLMSRENKEWF